ncbi:hydroxyethylthiazole kinase [Sporobacter termitidis DSM 10068]|uniref:Hydroxyethylthiazole kinase n=1 Tax=Sporobacter termitidis DSM 10068 TaxID=1123282 RepID=A0A1M5U6D8_9FIRM|nr:hydroxyethylthiazole kinase [Sporobacter termitidis]SHH58524.1 hydroxyethylthiazole kinase [Sporobacter termitidis DSM 10068]
MLGTMLNNVRSAAPLVHCITNYVTVNDCANILLAAGASPIMSDDVGEVEEITAICSALAVNIGTLNQRTIPAMFMAGKKAAALKKPIVLDPVGAGASKLRTETAAKLMAEVPFSVIRGNISEVKALALGGGSTRGVDADAADAVTTATLDDAVIFAKRYAAKTGAVVAVTGAVDIVTDGSAAYLIRNGHPMMSKITGSGCMLTALTGAFLASNPENILEAAAAALIAMGLCGEAAYRKFLDRKTGNATFRNDLIDAVFSLTGDALEKGARYEVR